MTLATVKLIEIPAFGAPLGGGFYAGLIIVNGGKHALIVSPKAGGSTKTEWGSTDQIVTGALSFCDGAANTAAMAEAGSNLAKWAIELDLSGVKDWYIPARDELELMYRHLKPSDYENACSYRDGENPSSAEFGLPYSPTNPAQTQAKSFHDGGEEAFPPSWHWSSTQYPNEPSYAWGQGFDYGLQGFTHRSNGTHARAVRRLLVIE